LHPTGSVYAFGSTTTHSVFGLGAKATALQIPIEDAKKISTPGITNKIVDVACGAYSSFLLDSKGNLWSFGLNQDGELGLGNKLEQYEPKLASAFAPIQAVLAGNSHTVVLTTNGEVWCVGM